MTRRLLSALLALMLLLTMCVPALADADSDACLRHAWIKHTDKKPDCTHKGREIWVCRHCGGEEQHSVKALGHKWGSWTVTEEATCSAPGSRYHICQRCDEQETKEIRTKDHSWGEWSTVREPAVDAVGLRERSCTVCGEPEREPIYPDGTLKKGDSGDSVKALQEALNASGHPVGRADGSFGKRTEAAIRELQEERGEEPNGIVLPAMLEELIAVPMGATLETEPEYSYGLELELVSGPEPASLAVGESAEATLRLTNTGNTYARVSGYVPRYLQGKKKGWGPDDDSVEQNLFSEESTYLAPGASVEVQYRITATAYDAEQGIVAREIYGMAWSWVDETTGLPMTEKTATSKPKHSPPSYPSNKLELEIELKDGSEPDYSYGFELELVSGPEPAELAEGETAEAILRLTNTGNTYAFVSGYMIRYLQGEQKGAGADADSTKYDPSSGYSEYLAPGASVEVHYCITATAYDMEQGVAAREIYGMGWAWADETTGLPMTEKTSSSKPIPAKPSFHSNTLEFEIELTESEEPMLVPELSLEIVEAPATVVVGGSAELKLRITNIGTVWAAIDSITSTRPDGEKPLRDTWSKTNEVAWACVGPGESVEAVYVCKPDEAGEPEDAYLHRELAAVCRGLSDADTGTPVTSADAAKPWTEVPGVYFSNEVRFTPELKEAPEYTYSILLEHVDGPTPDKLAEGENALATLRVTNAGNTYITVNGNVMHYSKGSAAGSFVKYDTMSYKDASVTGTHLAPGESYEITYRIVADPYDTAEGAGVVGRSCFVIGRPWINEASGTPATPEDYQLPLTAGSEEIRSNAIVYELPLLEPTDDDPELPDEPFGIITDLSVTKAEISVPQTGGYREENVIAYEVVVTNTGETNLTDLTVYDTLQNGNGVIGTEATLASGESRTYHFSYTVTKKDVEKKGYVTNVAFAEAYCNGYPITAESDPVISPCGKTPTDKEKGSIELPTRQDRCTRTLLSRSDTAVEYRIDYCAAHAALQDVLCGALEKAPNTKAAAKLAQNAATMWQAEVDALYDTLMQVADCDAKPVVMADRLMLQAEVAALRAHATDTAPETTYATELSVAELLRDRCVELCYTMATAPEARLDSPSNVEATEAADAAAACARVTKERTATAETYVQQLCEAHSLTLMITDSLLEGEAAESLLDTMESMWLFEAESLYNRRTDATGDRLYADEYHAFEQSLKVHKALLALLYPDSLIVGTEQTVRAAIDRVCALCEGE